MLKKVLMFTLLVSALALPAMAHSQMLATQNGDCRFFYPTTKNTQGWYIKTSSEMMCQNGFVNNHGEVTIYNAFSEPVEQFYGFFNGGYWTKDTPLSAAIIASGAQDSNTYKVFFELPADRGFDVQYVAQMISKKQPDKTYGPFSFCGPFRVLINTTDFGLFKDESLTTEMIDEIATHARKLCPKETMIQLYGATSIEPKMNDIFFFAEINLQTAKIDVKRNEAADFEKKAQQAQENENISSQNENNNITTETIRVIEGDSVTVVHEDPFPILKNDSYVHIQPKDYGQSKDKVPHLLLLSRLKKEPVYGKAVMEITRVVEMNGEAKTPSVLKLTGSSLHVGWAVVTGEYQYESGKTAADMKGSVQVSSVMMCEEAYCTDKEEQQ